MEQVDSSELPLRNLESLFQELEESVFKPEEVHDLIFKSGHVLYANNVSIDTNFMYAILESLNILSLHELVFKHNIFRRYVKNNFNHVELCSSLTRRGFFSHRYAAVIHGLLPFNNVCYINEEQKSGNQKTSKITQNKIKIAFSKAQRISNNTSTIGDMKIIFLAGANTGKLGMTKISERCYSYQITDIERTLIDLAVRPSYSGGAVDVYFVNN